MNNCFIYLLNSRSSLENTNQANAGRITGNIKHKSKFASANPLQENINMEKCLKYQKILALRVKEILGE